MITSAALLLPLVLSQVFTTLLSGYAIKWSNRARPSFLAGFMIWAAGQGAQLCFDESTSIGVIVVCLLLQGLGIGATIQSSKPRLSTAHQGGVDEQLWFLLRRPGRQSIGQQSPECESES